MERSQGADTAPARTDDLAQVKRKLAWRMGMAGLMIVGLLGALTLFDRLAGGPNEPEVVAPRFTEPVPVPRKAVTQAVGGATPAAADAAVDSGAESGARGVPESSAAPVDRTAPPPPEVSAQPAPSRPSAPGVVVPMAPKAVPPKNEPQKTVPVQTPRAERPAMVDAPVPTTIPATPNATVASTPSPSSAVVPAPVSRPAALLPALVSGYSLQAGVFADPRRAEDLHARLVQEGIPSTLETRVLVGPFRNQAEADAARAKMRALGVDAMPLPRNAKK